MKLTDLIPSFMLGRILRKNMHYNTEEMADVSFRLCRSDHDFERAFGLVYDAYLERGYIDPDETKMRLVKHHALPTTMVLIAELGDEVIGTTSLVLDTALGVPAQKLFPEPVKKLREDGHQFFEVASLAVKKTRRHTGVFLGLSKLLRHAAIEFYRLNCMFIAINPKAVKFYQHIFFFKRAVREVRYYEDVRNAPAVAMLLDIKLETELIDKYFKKMPFHIGNFFREKRPNYSLPQSEKDKALPNVGLNDEQFRKFFFEKTSTWEEMDEKDREIIMKLRKQHENE